MAKRGSAGPTVEVTPEYTKALSKFKSIFQDDQDESHPGNDEIPLVTLEAGRKFDRVYLAILKEGQKFVPELVYFVMRENGEIYGAKSPIALNEKHYYGTIFDASMWDWSGSRAKNVKDPSVKETGKYGDFIHYEKVAAPKVAKTAASTPAKRRGRPPKIVVEAPTKEQEVKENPQRFIPERFRDRATANA